MRFTEHLEASSELLDWFRENELSLVLGLPDEQALVFLSPDGEGRVRAVTRRIEHLRCLHADRSRVLVATDSQIHELVNVLPDSATYDGYDHIYILRRTHTTGAIDVRDLDGAAPGAPYFVSGRYNAVATLSDSYSFEVRWRPESSRHPFSEGPFRLTGVARDETGDVCYATGLYEATSADETSATGAVIDVDADERVTEGVLRPVCPQLQEGTLYGVDARNRGLFRIEDGGTAETVMDLPAVPTSLVVYENFALVTISGSDGEPDAGDSSSGGARTGAKNELLVLDLATGTLVGKAQWPHEIASPSDVQVLPGVNRPTALGPDSDALPRTIVFETDDGLVYHQIPSGREEARVPDPETSDNRSTSPPIPDDLRGPETGNQTARIGEGQEYSIFQGRMEARELCSRFQNLVPGRFRRRVRTGTVDPATPLIGVAATLGDRPVGVAAASDPDGSGISHAHALKVSPPHRGQGLGTNLLGRLERHAREAGGRVLEGRFRASLSVLPALERVLEKRNWEPPKVKRYLYKGKRAHVPKPFLEQLSQAPAEGTLFEWADLTEDQRIDVESRLNSTGESAIPASLSPFQLGTEPDLDCSVGLRHEDRVVGWMITHRVTEDLLQYTTLYVEPEFRGPGVGPTLLAEAIRRHAERTDIPKFIWMVDAEKERMRRFIDLRLSEVVDVEDKLLVAATRLREKPSGSRREDGRGDPTETPSRTGW